MWHLTDIPKIAHFYWATSNLPWVRYLAVETFRKHNPEWEIIMHRPTTLTDVSEKATEKGIEDWWPKLEQLGVKTLVLDVPQAVGIDFSFHPDAYIRDVHYSDFAYMHLLYKYGGLWANMDIVFLKPVEAGHYNAPGNMKYDVIGLIGAYNNFMLAKPQASPLLTLLERAKAVPPEVLVKDFSTTGPKIWEKMVSTLILRLPIELMEPNVHKSKYMREGEMFPIPPETIGIHWHGSGQFTTHAHLTLENYKTDTSDKHSILFGKLLQLALKEDTSNNE